MKPKVCILRTAGTNCDKETAFAFHKAGAEIELVHINELVVAKRKIADFQILALPGGFSYGDDLGAGRILANELRFKLADDLRKFVADGKLIIGICNGFQILVKAGLLPGNPELKQDASLILNDSAKFEDRWVYLKPSAFSHQLSAKCVWTKDLPEIIYLPVAHGEGKFIAEKPVIEKIKKNYQVVFQYCNSEGDLSGYPDNPNGAAENIAGICDQTGRVLGLMPHPERHIDIMQHPRWQLKSLYSPKPKAQSAQHGDGYQIFKNGVEYAKNI